MSKELQTKTNIQFKNILNVFDFLSLNSKKKELKKILKTILFIIFK